MERDINVIKTLRRANVFTVSAVAQRRLAAAALI